MKIMKSTLDYSTETEQIKDWLSSSKTVIVGAGAGLSAAGGINYMDEQLTAEWFPEYVKIGLKTIVDIQGIFWNITPENARAYYAFWARHIWNVRYKSDVLQPYTDLYRLLQGKDYFIITTNVDRQFTKAGFDENRILATQGDYGLFQCSVPCTREVYNNREQVERMVNHIVDDYYVRRKDIPLCPRCGNFLIPNLRKDKSFIEEIHMKNLPAYSQYVDMAKRKKITLLELGVGFNTPVVIRYPFENITRQYPNNVRMIRVNLSNATVPIFIRHHSLSAETDIAGLLKSLF